MNAYPIIFERADDDSMNAENLSVPSPVEVKVAHVAV